MKKQTITRSGKNSQDMKTNTNKVNDHAQANSSTSGCLFCLKFGTQPFRKIDFGPLLNRALHTKYATHTNPQASLDISQIIERHSVKWVIKFNDDIQIEEKNEYLTKYYSSRDRHSKFKSLREYFKYHKDIPRLFMKQLGVIVVNYFEKQKHLKYKKIKRMLGIPFDERTHLNTEMFNTDGEICKPHTYMILDGVTLDIKQPMIEQEPISQRSSQSLLKEILKNRPNDYNKINISDTWISMNQSNVKQKVVKQDPMHSPTSQNKNIRIEDKEPNEIVRKKSISIKPDQLSELRLQALLKQTKPQDAMNKVYSNQQSVRNQKSQNISQRELQEQLVRQLIFESCFKKKVNNQSKTKLSLNVNEQICYSQYSPKFAQSSRLKPELKTSFNFKDKIYQEGREKTHSQMTISSTTKNTGLQYKPPAINFQIQENIHRSTGRQEIKPSYSKSHNNINRILSNEKRSSQERPPVSLHIKAFDPFKNVLTVASQKPQKPEISPIDLKSQMPIKNLTEKQQTYYTEQSFSPAPLVSFQNRKDSLTSAKRLSQLMQLDQPKQKVSTHREQILNHQSQPDINININQLNMNNMHFQQRGVSQINRLVKSHSQSHSQHSLVKKPNTHYTNNYYHSKNPSIMKIIQNPTERIKPRFNSKLSLKLS